MTPRHPMYPTTKLNASASARAGLNGLRYKRMCLYCEWVRVSPRPSYISTARYTKLRSGTTLSVLTFPSSDTWRIRIVVFLFECLQYVKELV